MSYACHACCIMSFLHYINIFLDESLIISLALFIFFRKRPSSRPQMFLPSNCLLRLVIILGHYHLHLTTPCVSFFSFVLPSARLFLLVDELRAHRSITMGDRQKPIANRAVAERYQKYTHALHRANIEHMQPVLNTTPPPILPHLADRKKRDQTVQGMSFCFAVLC